MEQEQKGKKGKPKTPPIRLVIEQVVSVLTFD
jgi:hypothetical protein